MINQQETNTQYMKEKLQTLWATITNNRKKAIAAVLLLVVGFFIFGGNSNDTVSEATVARGNLVQDVSASGTTKPVREVDLAFETSGKISRAPLSVGSRVEVGQVLAGLDQSELYANVLKAQADLEQERIRLDQIGKQSGNTYENAKLSMIAAIKDAYVRADDAIKNDIDQFFYKSSDQSNPFIDFSFIDGSYYYTPSIDSSLKTNINSSRQALGISLNAWQKSLLSLSSASDLTPYITEAEANLNSARVFLGDIAQVVNSLPSPNFEYASVIAGYRNDVSGARTNVSTAIANLVTAKDKLNAAPKQTQGSTGVSGYDEVLSQQAQVARFEAELSSRQALLAKATLVAPIAGVVTKYDTKVGEIVSAGNPVISVISDNDLEIEANVSEVNIGKVRVGNLVSITFDAFPGVEYEGSVFYIDPGETIVDGVVNYKVKITFKGDENMKSGLTANLKIKTAEKQGVLSIPQYAVIKKDDKTFVEKIVNKNKTEVEVKLGFVGNDGTIEVIEGLSEGDVVQVGK